MFAQISGVPAPIQASTPSINRRSAEFHPSIWGDHFLSNASDFEEINEKMQHQHQKLKEEVRSKLVAHVNDPSEKLDLINATQRLGVSYHFECEIDEILRLCYNKANHKSNSGDKYNDIYVISLEFRLLRQYSYNISCDVFNGFTNKEGKFEECHIKDARGMLSLYEASHLRVHGEDILDEALAFTTSHLESIASHSSSPLREQIRHALKQPIHKGLQRLDARYFMTVYEEDKSHNEVLLNFAMLDFNLLQKLHQNALTDIARWWKELDFSNKLPFARDRLVECYFWTLGVYFQPEYALARKILTKVIILTSVIDDIYDVFGTPEELELFTEAVQRWHISAMDELPEYMRVCYKALLDVYEEIEENMINQGRTYRIHYAKEAMKNQVQAYFLESKWLHQQHVPTMEEYMPIAIATSGYGLLSVTSLVGMGDIVTEDSFKWLLSETNYYNKMVNASATIARLMDDIVSHEFEQKRGHVASSVECYMKQYGATEQEAVNELRKLVENAWKDINEECLNPTPVVMPILARILNLARVMDVVYKDEDGYTNVETALKNKVSSLLIDPLPISV